MRQPPSPFLLIDAGNTRVKWAVARAGGPIRPSGNIDTHKVTATWVRVLARKFPTHRVVLASVVPKLIPAFRRAFSRRLHVITADSSRLRFDYPKPTEIGADRLAAAVAIHAEGNFPAIIIACGTATAFTVLDAKGRFCGGIIAPGLQTQLSSLIGATAQLPSTALRPMQRYLAKSSQRAICAGVVLNFQGGVKEILHRLSKEIADRRKPALFLTGGNATYLTGILDSSVQLRPLLVFEGLLIIGDRIFTKTP